MKLRLARKIVSAAETPREAAYTLAQYDRAWRVLDRTESCRKDRAFFLRMASLLRLRPLTPKEAEEELAAAKPVPLSEERIKEIVRYATSGEASQQFTPSPRTPESPCGQAEESS
jgi:hypothetical protein